MNYILLAGSIIGLIQAGIGLAEKLLSGKGKGAEKRAAVIDAVAGAVTTGVASGTLRGDFKDIDVEAFKPILGMFIDMSVGILNKLGWTSYTLESPDVNDPFKRITP